MTRAPDGLAGQITERGGATAGPNPSPDLVGRPGDQVVGQRLPDQGADLVSFGRAYLADPELVERFRTGAPLHTADPDTYDEGGNRGYLDYVPTGTDPRRVPAVMECPAADAGPCCSSVTAVTVATRAVPPPPDGRPATPADQHRQPCLLGDKIGLRIENARTTGNN